MNSRPKTRRGWWRERFVSVMVIPERTRHVHKFVVPFFALKIGAVLFCLGVVLMVVVSLDYIHVLGRIAENKQLKGENYKLRQEIQVIRNKVESMETTVERVRNYAKKLQILTGQTDKSDGLPQGGGPLEEDLDRLPAAKAAERRSEIFLPNPEMSRLTELPLEERLARLENVSQSAEFGLSRLQTSLLVKSALIQATPSLLPIAGWVSSPFGYRRHPYDGSYRLHSGVDIVAEPGTPVRAPAPGLIVFAGFREGYGKVVVLDHGYGISSLFGHNSKLFVNSGMKVKRGETVAEVGSTGHSTGPHLHYEIRKNGVPVNPMTFLSRSRF